MFEYIIEKEEKAKVKNDIDVVGKVVEKFETFDARRADHLGVMDILQNRLYLMNDNELKYLKNRIKQKEEEYNEEDDWKSHINTNVLYSLGETYKAFLKETTYKNLDQLFDVEGENDDYNEACNIQKDFLLNQLEAMGAEKEFEKALEYKLISGETDLFTGWCEKYKTIKRPSEQIPEIEAKYNQKFKPRVVNGQEVSRVRVIKDDGIFATLRVPVYEGAVIKAINPCNLVYDADRVEDWDSCAKIIKEFVNPNDILNNKLYKLSSDCKQFLKNIMQQYPEEANRDDEDKIENIVIADCVEVLNYFGDWVQDGRMLKNWSIVVVARKYLVLFEENRFVINPIINEARLRNPYNQRGVPGEMLSILGLVEMQNKLMNDYNDISSLKKQPPQYAPKGFFSKLYTKIFPGKVLEYDATLQNPSALVPIMYEGGYDGTTIQFLATQISSTSGIFPNMQGQDAGKDTTATEIKTQIAGQTTRLQYQVDSFSKYCIIPAIRNIADLNANNMVGDYEFFALENGSRVKKIITDVVRAGDYAYKYNDQSALIRKKAEFGEIKGMVEAFSQVPEMAQRFKYPELYEYGMAILGVTNAQRFLKSDEEMQIQAMQQQMIKMRQPQTQVPQQQVPQSPMQEVM
jgi:hypothetical protein